MNFIGEINEMSAEGYIRTLEDLPSRSQLNLFLDTPGGDIYAGGNMVIATRKAMKERGIKVTVELGACVASMGASLVAAVRASGGRIIAHKNTAVMFHGCYGIVIGGADELADQAKAMQIFNDSVKSDLAIIGIDDTDDWFAADRQKWLGAEEMLELGLVNEIYEAEAEESAGIKVIADRLAAKLNHKEDAMDQIKAEEPKKKPEETPEEEPKEVPAAPEKQPEEAPAEPPAEPAPEPQPEPEKPEEEPECPEKKKPELEPLEEGEEAKKPCAMVATADFNAMRSKYDREISNLQNHINELNDELSARKEAETTLRDELAKAKADLDAARKDVADKSALEAEIAQLKASHEQAIAPALAHSEPVVMSAKDIAAAHMSAEEKVRALLKK